MNNLKEKIQKHFASEEVQSKLREIVSKHIAGQERKEKVLNIFKQIQNGDFDVTDLDRYMVEEMNMEQKKVFEFTDELFKEVLINIYLELQDYYESKQTVDKKIEKNKEQKKENEQVVPVRGLELTDNNAEEVLKKKYAVFLASSFWQNVLSAEEGMKKKAGSTGVGSMSPDWSQYVKTEQAVPVRGLEPTSSQGTGTNSNIDSDEFKNNFYSAINAGDAIKTTAWLRKICSAGKLKEFFKDDKRYIEFWSGVLERHNGIEEKNKFLSNPADKKYLVEFLRFILEKRVKLSKEDSVLVGVNLANLCREAGEGEYGEMVVGDEGSGSFIWQ